MQWVNTITEQNDPWFILFAVLLLVLGLMRQSEGERLRIFLRSFFNPLLLSQQVRQERAYNRITVPVFGFIIFTLSAFFLHLMDWLAWELPGGFWSRFGILVILLTSATLLRFVVYVGFSALFDLSSVLRLHNLQWLLHNFVMAIALLPITIVVTYGPASLFTPLMFIGLSILFSTYLLRAFRLFGMTQSELHTPLLYNVLYFCALEILPPVLIAVGVWREVVA